MDNDYVGAVIHVKVPKWQIGQECSIFFKDTMCVKGKCENERPKGKWVGNRIISCGTILKRGENVLEQQCTECKRFNIKWVNSIPNNFCSHCGADMREDDNDKVN